MLSMLSSPVLLSLFVADDDDDDPLALLWPLPLLPDWAFPERVTRPVGAEGDVSVIAVVGVIPASDVVAVSSGA